MQERDVERMTYDLSMPIGGSTPTPISSSFAHNRNPEYAL